jgi:hypothetical protein
MTTHFQLAAEKDTPLLVEMMREFYQHENLVWDEEIARSGLHKLFRDPGLGSAYIVLTDEHPAGYFVLTFPFSLWSFTASSLCSMRFISARPFGGRTSAGPCWNSPRISAARPASKPCAWK